MIIPDANLLLYSYDAASPFYAKASAWWRRCLTGRSPVGLCPVVLFAFVRIGTSRRTFEHPMTIEEADRQVRSWIAMPSTYLLPQEESDIIQALLGGLMPRHTLPGSKLSKLAYSDDSCGDDSRA
jgi:predicted nucleic acid-binding protein